jgi:hypothetical protein
MNIVHDPFQSQAGSFFMPCGVGSAG